MTKNFETLEVGREYLGNHGDTVAIVAHPYNPEWLIGIYKDFGACAVIFGLTGHSIYCGASLITLIEPVEVVEYWVNYHGVSGFGTTHGSRESADSMGVDDRVDIIHTRLEYEDGVLVESEVRSVKDD